MSGSLVFYKPVYRKGVFPTPYSLTLPINVSIHPLQGTNSKGIAKTATIWLSYSSFKGIVTLDRFLKLIDAMANQIISFILLAWGILDYFKSNHFSVEQMTIILLVVVLVIVPYSQKLKFLGVEFIRKNENKKRKVNKNDRRTNRSCKKEDR